MTRNKCTYVIIVKVDKLCVWVAKATFAWQINSHLSYSYFMFKVVTLFQTGFETDKLIA